jgi:hypothetical protein
MVDDFLLITPYQDDAELFLRTMLAGVSEYGCSIAPQKSVINFEPSDAELGVVQRLSSDADFAWCGFVVDQHLDLRLDLARQVGTRACRRVSWS